MNNDLNRAVECTEVTSASWRASRQARHWQRLLERIKHTSSLITHIHTHPHTGPTTVTEPWLARSSCYNLNYTTPACWDERESCTAGLIYAATHANRPPLQAWQRQQACSVNANENVTPDTWLLTHTVQGQGCASLTAILSEMTYCLLVITGTLLPHSRIRTQSTCPLTHTDS